MPACSPSTSRTPVRPGSAASSSYTRREASAHSPTRPAGSMRYGHHSAPATADVVSPTGSRLHTRTSRPDSARTTAVVRPMTPPPSTIICSLMAGR